MTALYSPGSTVFIACQTRAGEPDEFFSHEYQAIPPALLDFGQLHQSKKSDFVDILEKDWDHIISAPQLNPKIFDGQCCYISFFPKAKKHFKIMLTTLSACTCRIS